jgi:hypothetical protein
MPQELGSRPHVWRLAEADACNMLPQLISARKLIAAFSLQRAVLLAVQHMTPQLTLCVSSYSETIAAAAAAADLV